MLFVAASVRIHLVRLKQSAKGQGLINNSQKMSSLQAPLNTAEACTPEVASKGRRSSAFQQKLTDPLDSALNKLPLCMNGPQRTRPVRSAKLARGSAISTVQYSP